MYKSKRPAPEKGLKCTKKEPAFDYALCNTIHNPAPLSQLFPINIPNPQSTSPAPGHSKEKKTAKGKGKQANQVLITKKRSRSPTPATSRAGSQERSRAPTPTQKSLSSPLDRSRSTTPERSDKPRTPTQPTQSRAGCPSSPTQDTTGAQSPDITNKEVLRLLRDGKLIQFMHCYTCDLIKRIHLFITEIRQLRAEVGHFRVESRAGQRRTIDDSVIIFPLTPSAMEKLEKAAPNSKMRLALVRNIVN